jgi:16S rRNA C1402 N4-methylase RsmH
VKIEDAVALIRPAVEGHEGTWADLGAGRGTFTRALAQVLGRESRIYAVDADPNAAAELESVAKAEDPRVTVIHGDFSEIELPELDGVLLANSLHFMKNAAVVL